MPRTRPIGRRSCSYKDDPLQPLSLAPRATNCEDSRRGDNVNILLIEDDLRTVEAIVALLAREGVSVDHAPSGEAGIGRAGAETVDLILLDRMLPGMSGVDFVTRLRDAGIEKPVMMLSALGRAEHRIEGLNAGVDDYLAKPFEPDELVARLRALHRRTSVQARQPVLIHGDIELHV